MKKYLLPNGNKFYKANLHVHTTVSDGAMTPEEIKKIYMEMIELFMQKKENSYV